MAYDVELAERVRDLVGVPTTEKRMFGGLAFLVQGHMGVAVSGRGVLMVRCDPAETERLLQEPGAAPMVMRGKELAGWLEVSGAAVDDTDSLRQWVTVGIEYAATLPPKV